jgi:rubrerythrin
VRRDRALPAKQGERQEYIDVLSLHRQSLQNEQCFHNLYAYLSTEDVNHASHGRKVHSQQQTQPPSSALRKIPTRHKNEIEEIYSRFMTVASKCHIGMTCMVCRISSSFVVVLKCFKVVDLVVDFLGASAYLPDYNYADKTKPLLNFAVGSKPILDLAARSTKK